MALVTAKDFPAIFAQPDESGLARGIFQALHSAGQQHREREKEEAIKAQQHLQSVGLQLIDVRDLPDLASKRKRLSILAQEAGRTGKDDSVYFQALEFDDPDAMDMFLIGKAQEAVNAEKLLADRLARDAGMTGTKQQFGGQEIFKDSDNNLFFGTTRRDPTSGEVVSILRAVDGSGIQPIGAIQMVNTTGQTAEEKLDSAVEQTRQQEAIRTTEEEERLRTKQEVLQETEPQIAADVALAEDAVKKADELFEVTEKIGVNISNLKQARQAVLDGAGVGPIMQYWPSFTEASVRLDNMQGKLGLDIVGATTFGALSKGELDLSKKVALPTGLSPPDLITWIDDRVAAQEAKQDYLIRQAIFLSEKNAEGKQNTKADWAKAEKAALQAALDFFGATEEDIKATMKANNMDRSAVLAELRRRYERDRP